MKTLSIQTPSPLQELEDVIFSEAGVKVFLKRDDLIHSLLSGNKWRKLKYNLLHTQQKGVPGIITFGGAYSNHIHAMAGAGQLLGLKTIGIIRGDELTPDASPTLQFCKEMGMDLHFISRTEYRLKQEGATFQHIQSTNPLYQYIPEGGSNELALKGVGELVDEVQNQLNSKTFQLIVPMGTGGTAAGLVSRQVPVIGIPVLKNGMFLKQDVIHLLNNEPLVDKYLTLHSDYHFGGYAKYNQKLLDFISYFEQKHHIAIEQVYSAKMLFALYDLIKTGYFARESILVPIHTGGIQGKLNF